MIVNDVEVKTKADPANPTTVLIGKKGFEKLNACTANLTNRVFVRRQGPGRPVLDTSAFASCP